MTLFEGRAKQSAAIASPAAPIEFRRGSLLDLAGSAAYKAAVELAAEAYAGETRRSGETYLSHAMGVAETLATWCAPEEVVIAGLLHGVLKDDFARAGIDRSRIACGVSEPVAALVSEIAALDSLRSAFRPVDSPDSQLVEQRIGRHVPWVAARFARTPEAALVEIADRLENFGTVRSLDPAEQRRFALVSLFVIAPFADRFGMREAVRRLQNEAFEILDPVACDSENAAWVSSGSLERSRQLSLLIGSRLNKKRLLAQCWPLPGSLRASYLSRKAAPEAKRPCHPIVVVTENAASCYRALGIIHRSWPPAEHGLRDYIGSPKPNGYQGLHTRIRHQGELVDVLIRSRTMHVVAERGYCSTWLGAGHAYHHEPFDWVEPGPDKVAVLSPQGKPYVFTQGATVLDFAFKVHAELALRCLEAWIFDVRVALDQPLKTGDVVTIVESPYVAPTSEWLGWVRTRHARSKLRRALRGQESNVAIRHGRALVDEHLRCQGIDPARVDLAHALAQVARSSGRVSSDGVLEALGRGEPGSNEILGAIESSLALGRSEARPVVLDELTRPITPRVANCCHPVAPQAIIGLVLKRERGISVHRDTCPEAGRSRATVRVAWQSVRLQLGRTVDVYAHDRIGLLRDVTGAVSASAVSISSSQLFQAPDGMAQLSLSLARADESTIEHVRRQIAEIEGVVSALYRTRAAGSGMASISDANPFTLYPVKGFRFFGRSQELRAFTALVASSHGSVLVHGPRRIGKTSILQHVQETNALGHAFLPVWARLQGKVSVLMIVREIETQCIGAVPGVPAVKWNEKASPHEHVARLSRFLDAVAARSDKRLVLMLDEFQAVGILEGGASSAVPLLEFLRGETVGRQAIRLAVAASGPRRLLDSQLTAAGLESTVDIPLGFLSEESAREAITSPLSEIVFDEPVVERFVSYSAGHPFFLSMQAMQAHSWATQNGVGRVATTDLDEVLHLAVGLGETHFGHVWGEGTGMTRPEVYRNRLLMALISAGEPCSRSSLLEVIGDLLSEGDMDEGLRDLEEMLAICDADGQGYLVRVPLVRTWLFANLPPKMAAHAYAKLIASNGEAPVES